MKQLIPTTRPGVFAYSDCEHRPTQTYVADNQPVTHLIAGSDKNQRTVALRRVNDLS
jgi:hypothetical protein